MNITKEQYKEALTNMLNIYCRMNNGEIDYVEAKNQCNRYIVTFNLYQKQRAEEKSKKYGMKNVPVFKTDFVNMRRDYDRLKFAESIVS